MKIVLSVGFLSVLKEESLFDSLKGRIFAPKFISACYLLIRDERKTLYYVSIWGITAGFVSVAIGTWCGG